MNRTAALEVNPNYEELFLIKVVQHVGDKREVRDVLAQILEGVRHGLEAATLVGDGEVAFSEVADSMLRYRACNLRLPRN